MIEIDSVQQSFLLQGVDMVREYYNQKFQTTQDPMDEWFVKRIDQFYTKLPGLATGYVVLLPDELAALHQDLAGTIEPQSIQCRCGVKFSTKFDKAECPSCSMRYEVMENPRHANT